MGKKMMMAYNCVPLLVAACLVAGCCNCKKGNLNSLAHKDPSLSVYKVAMESDPQSLDPRLARDLCSVNQLHHLFEGLFRKDKQGKTCLALCSSYEIFDGGKGYRFRLRDAKWSNGDPVKASDFVFAWLGVLDPKKSGPYAEQLYVIEGAKAFNQGVGNKDAVRLFAEKDRLLEVHLERPQANFIELLTTHPFLPVSEKVATTDPFWAQGVKSFVSNGPFILKDWQRHHLLVLEKNPFYWQNDRVKIQEVDFLTLDNSKALSLFENNELNWVGSPLGSIPLDARGSLKNDLLVDHGAGTWFVRLNVMSPSLQDRDLRHALSLAIDRQQIVDRVVQGKQKLAFGLVPPFFDLKNTVTDLFDPQKARELYREVVGRLGESPPLVLLYSNNELNHKIAQVLEQQWREVLGLAVELKIAESKNFFHVLQSKEYDIALGNWIADIFDPVDFLEIFKWEGGTTNLTGWENDNYQALLDLSAMELDPQQRRDILSKAQEILMDERPLIPLFHQTFLHLENGNIKGVTLSPLGHMDFVDAGTL